MRLLFDTIHHIAVIGSDYEKAKQFYVDLLGFEVLRENYRKERDDWKLDLKLGNCELELFVVRDAPPRPSYPEACGMRHLAFKVENIEAAVQELEAKGISCEALRRDEFTGERMTFFFDPDGLPLEIHE